VQFAWTIPTFEDKVLQRAVAMVLEPIYEQDFMDSSYGFRPGRSAHQALGSFRDQQIAIRAGWVLEVDIQGSFDTIPHEPLMERISDKVADGRVLQLLEAFLTQRVMDGLEAWTPTSGSPQGAVISPLLSNAYLDPFGHFMVTGGYEMVRYADDFVILCRNATEAPEALERVRAWTASAGLTLHPIKTRIVDANHEGFDFLGYHFARGKRRPRDKSIKKFKDAIRIRTPRGHRAA